MEAETVNGRRLVAMTVFAVSYNRTALRSQVYTNLVRAAGLKVEFDEGILRGYGGRVTGYGRRVTGDE